MSHQGLQLGRGTKGFGPTRALRGVTLDVAAGEMVSILGPSGCGKSTLLRAVAAMLEIEPLLDRRPGQLSGGQRQRVALGRALVRRIGATTLFVTRDQDEAMAISDRIAVMFAGEVRQLAAPDELYRHPVDLDVARAGTGRVRARGPRGDPACGAAARHRYPRRDGDRVGGAAAPDIRAVQQPAQPDRR